MSRRKPRGRRAADRKLLAQAQADASAWRRELKHERRVAATLASLKTNPKQGKRA
jgi:hypothetical protein